MTRIIIEITAEDDGEAAALWADMLADMESDPLHRLILETRNWYSNVRFVEKVD